MEHPRENHERDELVIRFPTAACAVALGFTILMLFLLALNAFWLVQRENKLIQQNLQLQGLRGMLRYYDEALSMSVLMATLDPHPRWLQRYYQIDDQLNTAIESAMEIAPTPAVFEVLAELDRDNHQLILLERKALEHVSKGDTSAAQAILQSERYQQHTLEYAQGVSALANALGKQLEANESEQRWALILSLVIVALIITLIVVVWWVVVRHLRKWRDTVIKQHESRNRAEKALVDARTRLRHYAENFERSVSERTGELQLNMKATEAFSYSMAHDLRAPVRAMQGFAEALLEDYGSSLDEHGREYAERILAAARRMDRLIEDLMDYAALGREIPLSPVDPTPVLQQVIMNLEDEIQSKHADVRLVGAFPPVIGNSTLIDLIFTNLIANALKYVAPGVQPKVEIRAQELPETLKLSVTDNGIGIDGHDQQRIFDMFQRLHDHRRYSGTGIGLAIARRAAERMRSKIEVSSAPGRGSTFWVEFAKAANLSVEEERM